MVNSANFTKRLEKIISYYGLSATSFAEKINFNRSTISHLISGRNKPSLEFVMKVVQTFPEVELYWLLNGKGNFPPLENRTTQNLSHFQVDTEKTKTVNSTVTPEKEISPISKPIAHNTSQSDIERIIIFYKNGSFKEYLP